MKHWIGFITEHQLASLSSLISLRLDRPQERLLQSLHRLCFVMFVGDSLVHEQMEETGQSLR